VAEHEIRIQTSAAGQVSGLWTEPEGQPRWVFIYAPGAGSNLRDPFGAFLAPRLAERGVACLRFQFPYMEAGRRSPDRPATLEASWSAAIDAGRRPGVPLAIGGRSMGGRIASAVVAAGVEVDALALFAYPLHPPGRPDQTRDGHLAAIHVPTLFCSGTRDAFATPEELTAAATRVPLARVHILDGADHGYAVLKSTGRTRGDVWEEALSALDSVLGGQG